MADLDLKAIRNSLVELSRQAGRMIIDSYYSQNFSTDTKMNCKPARKPHPSYTPQSRKPAPDTLQPSTWSPRPTRPSRT